MAAGKFPTANYFRQLARFDRIQDTGLSELDEIRLSGLRDIDFVDSEIDEWHARFSSNPESNIQYYVVPLIRRVLDHDSEVKSVLNIGCKIAYFDAYLAEQYPHLQFTGVDLMRHLLRFNRRYARENLTLVSGYARKLLEKDEIGADLVYFTSTATAIRNRELRANLRNIAKTAKYLVFNEPIFTFPASTDIVDPNAVPLDKSFLIFTPDVPPGYEPPRDEDRTLCFVHNYVAIAEEAGFEIEYFDINLKDNVLPLVQVIARKA